MFILVWLTVVYFNFVHLFVHCCKCFECVRGTRNLVRLTAACKQAHATISCHVDRCQCCWSLATYSKHVVVVVVVLVVTNARTIDHSIGCHYDDKDNDWQPCGCAHALAEKHKPREKEEGKVEGRKLISHGWALLSLASSLLLLLHGDDLFTWSIDSWRSRVSLLAGGSWESAMVWRAKSRKCLAAAAAAQCLVKFVSAAAAAACASQW